MSKPKQSREPVIVEAVRTPVGRRNGQLCGHHPTDLLAQTLQHLVDRSSVDAEQLADVITGCALQNGEQAHNIGRWASLGASLPQSLPATTIDRQCGSGQQAVHFAAQGIRSGEYDYAIGCGVESMSRATLGPLFDPAQWPGTWFGQRALDRYNGAVPAQGPSAELIVRKWGLQRDELDEFSAESHRRAAAATDAGYFLEHLVPLEVLDGDGTTTPMTADEGIRRTLDPAKMAALKPAFAPDGAITAGNSSQISDGAAAVLVADRATAEAAGLRPKAAIRSMAVAADDPVLQFTAVLPATRIALEHARLALSDIDRIEINEAFACVPLLYAREFELDPTLLNVNGGSIAVGHPIGSTGARMLTDLVHELHRCGGRYGLLTICEGGGMANATIIERL